jgi:lysophospholipid acyltransferase (LPLAT)-like uncharacterized protein
LILGLLVRLWLMTLRVRLELAPELASEDRPWVLSFFHGTQFPLLAWKRRRRTVVMVSLSKDGEMQARALATNGFAIVRGSSSRGGARGLAALVRAMKKGADAAFAVDGPRGPYGEAKPGAILAAQRAGGVLVPMGSAAARAKIFGKAWDRFVLPWPFTTVSVFLGAPLPATSSTEELATAIRDANTKARANLAENARNMLPWQSFSESRAPK